MQYKVLLVFLLIGHLAFGQKGGLVKVPGTKCSLVPPDGFVLSTEFAGFWNAATGASIVLSETSMGYVETARGSFTAEALKARGKTFISRQRLDFNNSNGILIKIKETVSGIIFIKQIFIFGNDRESVVIYGNYPEKFKSLEGKITEALLSTVYNKSEKPDPVEAARFTINVDGSRFKVFGHANGGLVYTIDGNTSADTAVLVVGSSIGNVAGPDRKLYAQESLKRFEGFDKIRETNEITIDSLKGYEIIAHTKAKYMLYYVVLFQENGEYYFILGAGSNSAGILETYRKIARTFKRK
jgi:hypothetical protein